MNQGAARAIQADKGATLQRTQLRAHAGLSTGSDLLESIALLHAGAGNGAVTQLLGVGAPLPDHMRAEMGERFGVDFADVRVHDDVRAHASAVALGAEAYTHGSDIVFSSGRFAPDSLQGKQLLAHELAHVVQQRRGGAAPQPISEARGSPLEVDAGRAAQSAVSTDGPVTVAGACAPGIAREPVDTEQTQGQQSLESLASKGKPSDPVRAWRKWLQEVESMADLEPGWHSIEINGQLYKIHETPYQNILGNARAALGGQVGKLGSGATAVESEHGRIAEVNNKYQVIASELERRYGIQGPGDELNDSVLAARAYAHQAKLALDQKEFLTAFDYLEQGRAELQKGAQTLEAYRQELIEKTQEALDYILGKWGDLVLYFLGAIKGVGTQITDLADTAFWTANEIRNQYGGSTASLITTPGLMGLAVTHDVLKAAGVVDDKGRVSTTALLTGSVDAAIERSKKSLGSASDSYFTPDEQAEIIGALGAQVGMALVGAEEVQLILKGIGELGNVRTIVNVVRDKPDDWYNDTSLWSGVIGLALTLVGLQKSTAANKITVLILKNGWFASAIPPMTQFARDWENVAQLPEEELHKRLVADVNQIVQALFHPVVESLRAPQGGANPTETPPSSVSAKSAGESVVSADAGTQIPALAPLPDIQPGPPVCDAIQALSEKSSPRSLAPVPQAGPPATSPPPAVPGAPAMLAGPETTLIRPGPDAPVSMQEQRVAPPERRKVLSTEGRVRPFTAAISHTIHTGRVGGTLSRERLATVAPLRRTACPGRGGR